MRSKNSILIVLICFLCIFLSGCEKTEEDTINAVIENNGDTSCVSDSDLDHLICNEKSTFTIIIFPEQKYYCPDGYTLEYGINYATGLEDIDCIKKINTTETQPAIIGYDCEFGELIGTKCVDLKLVSKPQKKYSCSSGTLNGTSCMLQTKISVVQNVMQWCADNGMTGTSNCPSVGCNAVGGTYDGDLYNNDSNSLDWCYKLQETPTPAKYEGDYCPLDFVMENGTCADYHETDPEIKKTCPSDDYTYNGSECVKTISKVVDTIDANYYFSCPSGYIYENGVCVEKKDD